MKTNKILIGAVAAMTFVACQNEEWVDETPKQEGNRPQVEVTLSAEKADFGANTRYSKDLAFEEGDEIGVCLVDPVTAGAIADDVHTGNVKFVRQANGDFTSPSTIGKGQQLFYFPYNAKNTTTRGGVVVRDLGVQEYDPDGTKMAANDFLVSPVVNLNGYEAGAINLPMTLYSIYGYGNLTIVNGSNKEVEIQKVVITNGSNSTFALGGTLQPATFTANSTDAGKNDTLKVNLASADTAEKIAAAFEIANKVFVDPTMPQKRTYISFVKAAASQQGAVAMSFLTGTTGVKVAPGASINTRILIPAGSYVAANFKVAVYTNEGYAQLGNNAGMECKVESGNVNIYNSRTKAITATFRTLTQESAATGITVVGEADMIASLKQFAGNAAEEVTIKPTSKMTLTAEILSQVPSNVTLKFNSGSDITFSGNADLSKIKFADSTSPVSNVTMKDGTFNVSNFVLGGTNSLNIENSTVTLGTGCVGGGNSTITLKKESTLNLNSDLVANIDVESGTVNLGAASTRAGAAPAPIELYMRKVNTGTVNVNVPVNNNLALVIGDKSALGKKDVVDAVINVNADLTIVGNLTINADGELYNTSEGTTTVYDNKGYLKSSAGTFTVTTNNGKVDVEEAATVRVVTNNKKVNNKADAIANGGRLVVTTNAAGGVVNAVKNSQTDVSTNNGQIFVDGGAFVNLSGVTAKGAAAENGNVYLNVTGTKTYNDIVKDFKTPCTGLYLKDATLTIPAIQYTNGTYNATEYSKYFEPLKALMSVIVDGSTMTVNEELTFTKVRWSLYGNTTLNGSGNVKFSKATGDSIVLGNSAIFDADVEISGLLGVRIMKKGKVVARKQISGSAANYLDQSGTASWIGTAWKQEE